MKFCRMLFLLPVLVSSTEGTLSKSDKKKKTSEDSLKTFSGPSESSVQDKGVVVADVRAADILAHANAYFNVQGE